MYSVAKVRKRGNDVFIYNLERKLRRIKSNLASKVKTDHRSFTNCLFIVLTIDTNKPREKAWLEFSESSKTEEKLTREVNRIITNLTKQYGKMSYIFTRESTLKAYPHANLIAVFHNYRFPMKKHKDKDGVLRWRLKNYGLKKEIAKYWHYNVDIQALSSVQDAVNYAVKYITKDAQEIGNIKNYGYDLNSLRKKALDPVEKIANMIEPTTQKPKSLKMLKLNESKKLLRLIKKAQAIYKALLCYAIEWKLGLNSYSCSFDLICLGNFNKQNSNSETYISVIGIYNNKQLNDFLIWISKVRKYIDVILDENLLIRYLHMRKKEEKARE